MRIKRTIPPAAAPVGAEDVLHGILGMFAGQRYFRRLEQELKGHFGVRHVFLVSSGKAALTLTLRAMKALRPGKMKVVIPAYTCYSVPSAVIKAGLQVSLCDIEPGTLDLDHHALEQAIDGDTLCVVPTHLFGIPCDVPRIRELCKNSEVFVLEDAAQAMGGALQGRLLGTIGDAGIFSLGRGKNITCGSGGIIVTNSPEIAGSLGKEYARLALPAFSETGAELLKVIAMSVFLRPSLYWFPSSLPFLRLGQTIFYRDFPVKRLSGMHAGLLRNWKRNLEGSNEANRRNSAYFAERLTPAGTDDRYAQCLRFPYLAKEREESEMLFTRSQTMGLGVSRMYPRPVHEIEELKDRFTGKEYRCAKRAADTLLALPTHRLVTQHDRENICALIAAEPADARQDAARSRASGGTRRRASGDDLPAVN